MSARWLTALNNLDMTELVGLVDVDRGKAAARAEEFAPSAAIYTDLNRALRELQPEIAFDCSSPQAHSEIDLACLNADCDVLCEKPLALSVTEARDVVRTAARRGRSHAVMQNRRFTAGLQRLRGLLASGAIGTSHSLAADFYLGIHFDGFRAEMEHVLLMDMAVHTFDAARYLLSAEGRPAQPRQVTCLDWNPPGSWFRHGAAASAVFSFDDGRVFSYRGDWTAQGMHTSWEAEWRVLATEGAAFWDGAEQFRVERGVSPQQGRIHETEELDTPPVPAPEHTLHQGCIHEFLSAREEGREAMTASRDNIYSLAMALSAVESAETGRLVDIDLKLEER